MRSPLFVLTLLGDRCWCHVNHNWYSRRSSPFVSLGKVFAKSWSKIIRNQFQIELWSVNTIKESCSLCTFFPSYYFVFQQNAGQITIPTNYFVHNKQYRGKRRKIVPLTISLLTKGKITITTTTSFRKISSFQEKEEDRRFLKSHHKQWSLKKLLQC